MPGPAQAPVLFTPLHGGRAAHGFAAGFLTKSSRAVLAARRTDPRWRKTQEPLAHAAERLLGALAETGEVALIDEACGVVPEPDAYAKTATDAGAAEAIAELRQQLAIMGHNLERAVVTAREQSEGNARGWARVGELERQLKALSAGPVSPQQLEWMKERMREIASLHCRVRTRLSFEKAYARVQTDVRETMKFTLEWDEFAYGRFDDLRLRLKRMHKTALKEAREAGYDGSDTWTQPPFPGMGFDDDEGDE